MRILKHFLLGSIQLTPDNCINAAQRFSSEEEKLFLVTIADSHNRVGRIDLTLSTLNVANFRQTFCDSCTASCTKMLTLEGNSKRGVAFCDVYSEGKCFQK